ncbi:ribulose phosphate epimerase [Paraliomyxa miuraensis]|uniref:ribulose phosphate epimerase n=1 Tax=Paraliomyxa miuraensis TaxID=376150 RepID=UPI00225424E6|nr:ribulose phosphate epimerase [Paraliomyxa miuraensis]MCX4241223.1 ribulose phosphate epimerase [Paraliomyxa miuraensis]
MIVHPSSRRVRSQEPRHGQWAVVLVLALGLGCGPTVEVEDDTTSTTGTNPTSTSTSTTGVPPGTTTVPPGTTVPPPPDETTTGPADTGLVFLDSFGDPAPTVECDVFAQDCPLGEKCMPWANDGGNAWNATRCSPVVDDAAGEGEPCLVEGSGVSGIDSCDYGLMCWDVDPETLEGTCVPFCTGDQSNPQCPDGLVCVLANDGILPLCLAPCDPLVQDCDGGLTCVSWADQFVCVPPFAGGVGGPGDPCEFVAACEPGLMCLAAEYVPDCMALGCCSPLCDLTDPMPACLPGQMCLPWYERGMAPPGYENVGACVVPM